MASLYKRVLGELEGHYPFHNPDFSMFHKLARSTNDAYRGQHAQAPALEAACHAYCLSIEPDGTLGWKGYVEGPTGLSYWTLPALECLQEQAANTQNSWLKARYNHIIWRLIDGAEEGRAAVDAYIAVTSKYARLTAENTIYYRMLIQCVRAAHRASGDLSYRTEDVQNQILRIVKEHENLRTAGRAVQLELMKIVAHDERFPRPAVQVAADLAGDLFRRSIPSQSSHIIRQASVIGAQLHARLGRPPEYWRSIVTATAA